MLSYDRKTNMAFRASNRTYGTPCTFKRVPMRVKHVFISDNARFAVGNVSGDEVSQLAAFVHLWMEPQQAGCQIPKQLCQERKPGCQDLIRLIRRRTIFTDVYEVYMATQLSDDIKGETLSVLLVLFPSLLIVRYSLHTATLAFFENVLVLLSQPLPVPLQVAAVVVQPYVLGASCKK